MDNTNVFFHGFLNVLRKCNKKKKSVEIILYENYHVRFEFEYLKLYLKTFELLFC